VHHWSLAIAVLVNAWVFDGGDATHRWLGYTALALVGARLVWGFVGSPHARFSSGWPTLARLRAYLARPRVATVGHNPLGLTMAMLMLALVVALGISGWLMGTDRYWGESWLQDLHTDFSSALLACAAIHVAAVVIVSVRTRINLPRAMMSGWKERGPRSSRFE
jgi:Cytochrome b